jgi:hypothetical protein
MRVRPMFERERERESEWRGRQDARATGRPGREGAQGGASYRGGDNMEELVGGLLGLDDGVATAIDLRVGVDVGPGRARVIGLSLLTSIG